MAGYKLWAHLDELEAVDLNGYLMEQVVARFTDAAERSAAIAAPSDGQLTYLTASNELHLYDGAAWVRLVGVPAGGTTGQVLSKASDADYDLTWATLP